MDLPIQIKDREISSKNEKIILRDEVETLYEKAVTPFWKSGCSKGVHKQEGICDSGKGLATYVPVSGHYS